MTGIVYAFAAYGLVCALCAVIAVAVIARAVRAAKRTPVPARPAQPGDDLGQVLGKAFRDMDAELDKILKDGGRG